MMLLQKAHHINFMGKPNWNDDTVMFSLREKKETIWIFPKNL